MPKCKPRNRSLGKSIQRKRNAEAALCILVMVGGISQHKLSNKFQLVNNSRKKVECYMLCVFIALLSQYFATSLLCRSTCEGIPWGWTSENRETRLKVCKIEILVLFPAENQMFRCCSELWFSDKIHWLLNSCLVRIAVRPTLIALSSLLKAK